MILDNHSHLKPENSRGESARLPTSLDALAASSPLSTVGRARGYSPSGSHTTPCSHFPMRHYVWPESAYNPEMDYATCAVCNTDYRIQPIEGVSVNGVQLWR